MKFSPQFLLLMVIFLHGFISKGLYGQRGIAEPNISLTMQTERQWAIVPPAAVSLPPYVLSTETLDFRSEALYRQALSVYDYAVRLSFAYRRKVGAFGNPGRLLRSSLAGDLFPRRIAWRANSRMNTSYNHRLTLAFRRIMQTLDSISSAELRKSERFLGLQRIAYRRFAIHEIADGSYLPALAILKRYAVLDGAREEWPMHYYTGLCYDALYRRSVRNTGIGEGELRKLRRNRNRSLLRAVELKFGMTSGERKFVIEKIRLDELGPPRPE